MASVVLLNSVNKPTFNLGAGLEPRHFLRIDVRELLLTDIYLFLVKEPSESNIAI